MAVESVPPTATFPSAFKLRAYHSDSRAEAALSSGMKVFAAMLSAILVAAGIFCVVYQKQVSDRIHGTFESKMATSDSALRTSTPKPRPRAPEMSLAQAIRIKTPDGELTIPKGARVRVIERATLGTVAVNYQGYTAPVPSDALIPVVP